MLNAVSQPLHLVLLTQRLRAHTHIKTVKVMGQKYNPPLAKRTTVVNVSMLVRFGQCTCRKRAAVGNKSSPRLKQMPVCIAPAKTPAIKAMAAAINIVFVERR